MANVWRKAGCEHKRQPDEVGRNDVQRSPFHERKTGSYDKHHERKRGKTKQGRKVWREDEEDGAEHDADNHLKQALAGLSRLRAEEKVTGPANEYGPGGN